MAQPYFASAYMRLLYRFLQLPKAREPALFSDTGVDAPQLMTAHLELPFTVQMQICRNALAISQPGLGLRIGGQLQLAAHGALGTAMQNADTLRIALETFAELGAVRASFFSLQLERAGDDTTVTLGLEGLDDDLVPFFSESLLATIHHCASFYASGGQSVRRLEVAYASPGYAERYASAFEVIPEFDAPATRMHFATTLMELPGPEPDRATFTEAVNRCRQEMEQRAAGDTTGAIEQFLWNNPGKLWRVDELAGAFGTSTRTLLRRLAAEDTTFQAVRDVVLQQQAEAYLASLSVADTAAALGFSEESSFRRAFKRWCGTPPGDFRQALLEQRRDAKP